MYIVLSDIHANLEALNAVLSDIRKRKVRRIICLGDIVGYGPNPKECLDISMEFDLSVLGNHDEAALFEEEAGNFNPKAYDAIEWTRNLLDKEPDMSLHDERWAFLAHLKTAYREDGILCVHGSPRNPVKEYIFPEDVKVNAGKLDAIFSRFEHIAFIGHTHIPGIIVKEGGGYRHFKPEEFNSSYKLNGQQMIINVGSVGQPRDGNAGACYIILNETKVDFCRVAYDYHKTMRKIMNAGLDKDLAERLAEGR